MFRKLSTGRRERARGFSLILSLTVMAMLLLLCLSVAALMAVELRVARASVLQARARLNAVAGARIALGEVQRLTGGDRRITAGGAILGTNATAAEAYRSAAGVTRPRYVGVWKGPEGEGRRPAVSPVADYTTDHEQSFLGWLASGREASVALTELKAAAGVQWARRVAVDTGTEWLLLAGGARPYQGAKAFENDDPRSVYARPEVLPDAAGVESGRFAWVALDESQKARVDLRDAQADGYDPQLRGVFRTGAARAFHPGYAADGATPGKWQSYVTAYRRGEWCGWGGLANDPHGAGWFPVEAGGGDPVKALRHDFTTESVSLLTDTANGGLKRDLSLLAVMRDEDFDALTGDGDLPNLGGVTGYIGFENPDRTKGRNAWRRATPTWAVDSLKKLPEEVNAAVWPRWSEVREWLRFPTAAVAAGAGPMLQSGGEAGPYLSLISFDDQQKAIRLTGVDRGYQPAWRQPVLSRYRVEVRFAAKETAVGSGRYNLVPHVQVVAQLWNPYNVALRLSSDTTDNYFLRGVAFPLVAEVTVGTATTLFGFNFNNPSQRMGASIPLHASGAARYLAPGEVRTYSFRSATELNQLNEANLSLSPGYAPSGGATLTGWAVLSGVSGGDAVSVKVRPNRDLTAYGSSYCTFGVYRGPYTNDGARYITHYGAQAGGENIVRMVGPEAAQTWNNVAALTGQVGQLKPAMVFEMRLKSEAAADTPGESGAAWLGEPPGLHRPFQMKEGDAAAKAAGAYEFLGWGVGVDDPEHPRSLAATENPRLGGVPGGLGYMGTGNSAASGVGKYVYHRVPLHPPVGLLDLRHARMNGGALGVCEKGAPAYDLLTGVTNPRCAFGHSLASPWVSPGAVVGAPQAAAVKSGKAPVPVDMTWVTNAAIADTWFVSSLGDWDKGVAAALFPKAAKNAYAQWQDFYAGRQPLPNRRLAPVGVTPGTLLDSAGKPTREAFGKIAQQLVVEGGFNVNSTSVRAWRAFLASLNQDRPEVGAANRYAKLNEAGVPVESKADAPVVAPVATVFNDDPTANPAAEPGRRVNGGFALTDAQLDKLAQQMVNEVKKRGPFLSLGEFLNRRVEAGELGAKGAVQAAIDAAGLNDHTQSTARKLESLPLPNPETHRTYANSGVGQPGWLSQADLLAPLANALTPRGDTFTVLAAGECDGVRCAVELTVQRGYEYIDAAEAPETELLALKKPINRALGRRLRVVGSRAIEAPHE